MSIQKSRGGRIHHLGDQRLSSDSPTTRVSEQHQTKDVESKANERETQEREGAEAAAVHEELQGAKHEKGKKSETRRASQLRAHYSVENERTGGDAFELGDGRGDRSIDIELQSQPTEICNILDERTELLGQNCAQLKAEAARLVDEMVAGNFAPEVVAEREGRLGEIRQQLASLHHTMLHNNRRARLLRSAANNVPNYEVALLVNKTERLSGGQGTSLSSWNRVVVASEAKPPSLTSGQAIYRLPVAEQEEIDRHKLGVYVAQTLPGTVLSTAAVSMLEHGLVYSDGISATDHPLHPTMQDSGSKKGVAGLARWVEILNQI